MQINEPARAYDFQKGEVLLFDKPLGWTSFDLVRKVRNSLSRKLKVKKLKVGHAGTLDPLASGLMVLCTGGATKQIDALQAEEKEYIATLKIGATTPSYDLETEEDERFATDHIDRELIEKTLRQFVGVTQQVPPVFSAVKVDGKRAYDYARKGSDLKLNPKEVVISSIELISLEMPQMVIRVTCGKGTYIRALARDLGEALGAGAYLTGLQRTRSGHFSVEEAFSIDEFLAYMNSEAEN